MGEDPRHIQQQIDETRERMGDTVGALAGKADVPGRVKGSVAAKKDAVAGRLSGARERMPDAGEAAHRGAGMAQENPIGLAVGAIAAGFVVGMLLPATRVENEHLGPVSDQIKEQAREVSGEAVQHGKELAQDVAESAAGTARESGREHADQLRESVSERTPTS
jgi:gas vesicle protein